MNFKSVFTEFPILETKNLILRDMRPEDAEDLYNYFSNREISKYLGTYGPQTLESASEAIEYFRNRFRNGKAIRWAIVPKCVGKIVGTFSYEYFDNNNTLTEIAYELAWDYWREGIMSEVFTSVIPFGFEQISVHRIQATVSPQNIASLTLLKKFGFQEEGLLRKYKYHYQKKTCEDRIMLSLLEWGTTCPPK
jgi:Acetyltransferases, including N-acetylases of ribosomal proteins